MTKTLQEGAVCVNRISMVPIAPRHRVIAACQHAVPPDIQGRAGTIVCSQARSGSLACEAAAALDVAVLEMGRPAADDVAAIATALPTGVLVDARRRASHNQPAKTLPEWNG